MAYNLSKIRGLIKKELKRDWKKLSFEYLLSKDELRVTTNLKLCYHEDDIQVIFHIYSGGMATYRAVFDKMDKNLETLNIVNDFNRTHTFFTAFVRSEGYLELRNAFAYFSEKHFQSCSGEFLSRLADLADDKYLKELTAKTSAE